MENSRKKNNKGRFTYENASHVCVEQCKPSNKVRKNQQLKFFSHHNQVFHYLLLSILLYSLPKETLTCLHPHFPSYFSYISKHSFFPIIYQGSHVNNYHPNQNFSTPLSKWLLFTLTPYFYFYIKQIS